LLKSKFFIFIKSGLKELFLTWIFLSILLCGIFASLMINLGAAESVGKQLFDSSWLWLTFGIGFAFILTAPIYVAVRAIIFSKSEAFDGLSESEKKNVRNRHG
jgi:hypothetical protein